MKLFRSRKRPVSREVTHRGVAEGRGGGGRRGGGGIPNDGARRGQKEERREGAEEKEEDEEGEEEEEGKRKKKKKGTNLANFRKPIRENVSVHRGPKRGEPRTVNQPGKIREHWTRGRQTSRKTLTTRMVLF